MSGAEALKARTVRRKSEKDRWRKQAVLNVKVFPWNAAGEKPTDTGVVGRKPYITRGLIREHGATENCGGCDGSSSTHTEPCKARFEQLFQRLQELQKEEGPKAVPEEVPAEEPAAPAEAADDSKEATMEEQDLEPAPATHNEIVEADDDMEEVLPPEGASSSSSSSGAAGPTSEVQLPEEEGIMENPGRVAGAVRRRVHSKRALDPKPAVRGEPESKTSRHLSGLSLDVCQEQERALPLDPKILVANLTLEHIGMDENEFYLFAIGDNQNLNNHSLEHAMPTIENYQYDLGDCENVRDVATGEVLPAKLVLTRRTNGMDAMRKFRVWKLVPESGVPRRAKRVRMKWVDLRRSPEEMRCRLVAMEIAYDFRGDTFAGTPPLAIIRLLLCHAATGAKEGPEAMLITIYDVKCAFLHAAMEDEVHVRLPEGRRSSSGC